jgi:hypothetical protein
MLRLTTWKDLAKTFQLARILGVVQMDLCALYIWPITVCLLLYSMASFPEMINILVLDVLYLAK